MRKGIMPNLAKAIGRGVRSDLLSIIPPLTPPAWTSLATGRSPGHHGVFDFFQKESADSLHLRLALSSNIRAETLWTLANRKGKRTTVLNFPVTFPPSRLRGSMISGGWLTWRQFKLACHPQELYDEIRNLEGLDLKALVLDMSHEEKAVEGCSSDEKLAFVESHTQRERYWFKVLSHLMDKEPTEIVAILFDGTDKIQHLCWPTLSAWAEEAQESPGNDPILAACLEYFGEIDRTLGRLMDRMEPETHLMLVSDHGFGESRDIFFVNQWLNDNGYLYWKEDQSPEATDERSLGMARISRHTFEMDWERTRAFAATPSSNGIHVLPIGSGDAGGVNAEAQKSLVEELAAKLGEVLSPTTGSPMVERVWKREEAFPGPYGTLAPDLTLSLWDGGLVSILASDNPVLPRPAPVGVHRAEGIFVGLGPRFVKGRKLDGMSLLDVAPTALHLLGLPVPIEMEGRPPVSAFEAGFRKITEKAPGETDVRQERPSSGSSSEQDAILTEEDEQKIAERLKQLGYLD